MIARVIIKYMVKPREDNMKKAKILTATALLAALTTLSVGCGEKKFDKVFTGRYKTEGDVKIVTINENLDSLENHGRIYVGLKTNSAGNKTQYFYSSDGRFKFSLTDSQYTSYSYQTTYYGMYVTRTDDVGSNRVTKYTYYDNNLNVLVSESEYLSTIAKTEDFIFINNEFYQLDDDGEIKTETKKDAGLALNYKKDVAGKVEKFNDKYYQLDSSEIFVYNDNLELVASYTAPSYIEDDNVSSAILPDGNVLIQSIEQVSEFDKKYDFELSCTKFKLYTSLLNVKKNTVKDIKADYLLNGRMWALDGYDGVNFKSRGWNPDLKAVYSVSPIKDKRVSIDDERTEFVTLSNNGKIKSRIEKQLVGQSSIPRIVAENRYVCADVSGVYYLLDQNGKVLTRLDSEYLWGNGCYAVNRGADLAVYDFDANLVKTYSAKSNPTKVSLGSEVCAIKYTDNDNVRADVYKNGAIIKTYTLNKSGDIQPFVNDSVYRIAQNFGNGLKNEYYDMKGNLIARETDDVSISVYDNILERRTKNSKEYIVIVEA